MLANIQITKVAWCETQSHLRLIRIAVFIEEQQVEPDFEWDEIDESALHLLALINNEAVACLRIIDYKKIGRMAVLKPWRGLGVGTALMVEAIKICTLQGSDEIKLSAQTHAIGFYTKAGFAVVSDEYTDVDIAHVDMQLILHNKL